MKMKKKKITVFEVLSLLQEAKISFSDKLFLQRGFIGVVEEIFKNGTAREISFIIKAFGSEHCYFASTVHNPKLSLAEQADILCQRLNDSNLEQGIPKYEHEHILTKLYKYKKFDLIRDVVKTFKLKGYDYYYCRWCDDLDLLMRKKKLTTHNYFLNDYKDRSKLIDYFYKREGLWWFIDGYIFSKDFRNIIEKYGEENKDSLIKNFSAQRHCALDIIYRAFKSHKCLDLLPQFLMNDNQHQINWLKLEKYLTDGQLAIIMIHPEAYMREAAQKEFQRRQKKSNH